MSEKKHLEEKLVKAYLKEFPTPNVEPADEVDVSFSFLNQAMVLRLLDREAGLLRKIEKALERIDRGNFGICEMCGEAIGLKRLQVRPVADLCIKCKEDEERREVKVTHSYKPYSLGVFDAFHMDEE